ncbi:MULTISPECIES: hypothetical protein [unclassified Mesorhizobium]|uniref:hypothetical protein n=1 Tax=unclassified Mesorhizobium TaxID=325217 RepID=UPI001CCCDA3F|nr:MULTISPECIES: hypothetical protein [unclassified Mesorhizobium]MBZ9919990.1 hypothetical protein [Mesorhizobium sp. BR1-1-7]MBZ9954817.1 hypothetical protein [Mesorhizobium sp. BR1-1-15]MBZ9970982.1 hypothetical protein [Mesorhizobium sp. BR1-1-12]
MAISLLFTGHMVDKPGRPKPRFPADLEKAASMRIVEAIRSHVPIRPPTTEAVMGFASGAMGGDILFHEQCRAHGIRTTIVLPFSPDVFVRTSVQGIPHSNWEHRFWQLWNDTPEARRETMDLPETDEAYGSCNIRLFELARRHGKVHLIALWDGKSSDGPGGTADLVARASQSSKPDIIEPASLRTGS